MIHNELNKITRNYDHRNGVIVDGNKAGTYKLHVGYHKYHNAYNFLTNPPIGSVGTVKPVQGKSNPVVWTPDTNDKRIAKESSIEHQFSTPGYTTDSNLGAFTPFGTPPYYNSYETYNLVNVPCPAPIYLNLVPQKKVPVAMKVENVQGNFTTIWIYLGWNESRVINNKTYTVYKHYFSFADVAFRSPYFLYIPWTWSVYWGGCIGDCNNPEAWTQHSFKEEATTKELIKRAKTGGSIAVHFMLTGSLDIVCGEYYYKRCVVNPELGCCDCEEVRASAKITIFYQHNHPDWDRV